MRIKKETLTRSEYLQLMGLKTLADRYHRMMLDVRESIEELMGLERFSDEVSDFIWSIDSDWDTTVDVERFLERLNVTAEY
ncbi:MAG TPA: hypothetical protein VJS44_08490 [Pyrinomonadaceae bacterium]|nr:hypothetical protein [Pyrinomonadaceae bacterium]